MGKTVGVAAAVLALVVSSPAYSHGGHEHVMGTVAVADAKHMELKTIKGRTVSVRLTDETKYFQGKKPVKKPRIEVGTRVVVDVVTEGDQLTAKEVHLGTAPGGKSDASPGHDPSKEKD